MSKILAVDDDGHTLHLIRLLLERQNYQVVTASDGVEALEMVAKEHPDLIICDVMMPQMSGFEVLRALKANPETATIPIMMLTARTGDTDISDLWSYGVDLHLAKPFDPGELIQFVERILAR